MFKSLKLAHKLPLLIVFIALTLTVVLIAVSTTYFRRSVVADAENFMTSLVRDRELALHSYLKGVEAATLTIASVPSTAKAVKDLSVTWSTREGADKEAVGNLAMFASAASPYDVHFNRNLPPFQRIIERMGFYNVALVSPEGNVVFSATQEDDYTSNLMSGPYQTSGLGEVFQKTVSGEAKQVYFSDIAAYEPSGQAPAAFAATQIIDEAGRFIGVFAVQITADEITRITANSGGDQADPRHLSDRPGPQGAHPVTAGSGPCGAGRAAPAAAFRDRGRRGRHRGAIPPCGAETGRAHRCCGDRPLVLPRHQLDHGGRT